MTTEKFDYKKWIVESKFGKTPSYSNYSMLNEQTGSEATGSEATGSEATGSHYSCTQCECVEDPNGPFSSLKKCQETGCEEDLESFAIGLGIQPGTPGVDGTEMSAEDQFCIKCQSNSWPDDIAEKCNCCDTDYTYDDNVVTYDPTPDGMPAPPDKGRDTLKPREKERSRALRENKIQRLIKKINKLID